MNKTTIKIALLGESNTGKSTIAFRMVKDYFTDNLDSTIGASFMTMYKDNIKYDIWDTAGQERYLAISKMYYRNSDIIIFVFDVNNIDTINRLFIYLKEIVQDIKDYQRIIIIGNKIDLYDNINVEDIHRYVFKRFNEYSKYINQMKFIYLSAKTGVNYTELTDYIKITGNNIMDILLKNHIKDNKPTIKITHEKEPFNKIIKDCQC